MSKFFITGLPRCRSAWFANLLSYGDSFCYHDGWHGCQTQELFRTRLKIPGFNHVGNSDPANAVFWRYLAEEYPTARWVVVMRNVAESEAASKKAFFETFQMPPCLPARVAEVVANLKPLLIDFRDVSEATAYAVADYCGVNPGPHERVQMLCRTQVQVLPRLLYKATPKPLPEWVKGYL